MITFFPHRIFFQFLFFLLQHTIFTNYYISYTHCRSLELKRIETGQHVLLLPLRSLASCCAHFFLIWIASTCFFLWNPGGGHLIESRDSAIGNVLLCMFFSAVCTKRLPTARNCDFTLFAIHFILSYLQLFSSKSHYICWLRQYRLMASPIPPTSNLGTKA